MSWWIDLQKICCGKWTSVIQQNTKRDDYNVGKGKQTSYMATAVDKLREGSSDQSFLPVDEKQTATESSYIPSL
jgi:hypothetical protein